MLPPQPDNPVYAVFAGLIDQSAVQRLFQGLATATTNGMTHVHLLLQSTGGLVGDGICLYNFFRSYPLPLTVYNVGQVSSIATLAYLGAIERKASAYATFMIHRSYSNPQGATSDRLKAIAETLVLDDERSEAILRERLVLPEDKWLVHKSSEVWLTAQEAVSYKLATSIGEFAPPAGARIFYL